MRSPHRVYFVTCQIHGIHVSMNTGKKQLENFWRKVMRPKKPDVAARQFIASTQMKCLAIFLSGNVCHSLTNKLQAQPAHPCEQINGPGWEIAIGTPKQAFLDNVKRLKDEKKTSLLPC